MKKKTGRMLALALCVVGCLSGLGSAAVYADTAVCTGTVDLEVTYGQTEARSMLSMINEWRTTDGGVTYEGSDGETYTVTGLEDLTYDYKLEEYAMLRAAELADSFSHTRPDGTSALSGISEYVTSWNSVGENIACGYTSAEAAFEAWQEADCTYDAQGHRRNMLGGYLANTENSNTSYAFNTIAIGHAVVNGKHYWVQEFAKTSSQNTTETTANDSSQTVSVSVSRSAHTTYVKSDTVKSATCEEAGYTGDTWCSVCNTLITPGSEVAALGHDYGYANGTWSWSNDYSTATLTATCKNDPSHTDVQNAVIKSEVTTEPTCEAEGVRTYTATVTVGDTTYTDSKTKAIEATGHDYNYANGTWSWSEDYSTATLTATCKNDSSHTVTQDATIESKITTAATCEAKGVRTYTATVTVGDATYKDNKTEAISATGHDYNYASGTWSWSDDYSTATLTATCKNDPNHTDVQNAVIKSEVTTEPTCEAEGVRTYTATVTVGDDTYTDSTTAAISAMGHDYDYANDTWSWSNDYSTATLTAKCKNDPSHTDVQNAVIKSEVTTEPTCEAEGVRIYTATVTVGDTTYTDSKTKAIEATGHDYNYANGTWEWSADYSTATLTATCANDTSHTDAQGAVITEEVTVQPTCEEAGTAKYTATVTINGATYTDDRTGPVSATGHDYNYANGTWSWSNDYSTATLTAKCKNDPSHTDVREAGITSAEPKQACEDVGTATYTATVTVGGIGYTDEKTKAIPAAGHTPETVAQIDATYETEGCTAGTKCSVCGKILSGCETIPKLEKESSGTDTGADGSDSSPSGTTGTDTTASDTTAAVTFTAATTTGSAVSTQIAAGKSIRLLASSAVTWTVSNSSLATVKADGTVTFSKKAAGKTVKITGTAANGETKTFTFKCMKGAVKKIRIVGKKTVKAGKSLKLKVKVTTTKGKANKKVTWTSNKPSIAKVSSSGKVKTFKGKKGKVKITATATDGTNKKATITIRVK